MKPQKPKSALPITTIEGRIHLVRGHKVILDRDLAELYGVSTKALNQAVKRNSQRFPDEFVFRAHARGSELFEVTICDLKRRSSLPSGN